MKLEALTDAAVAIERPRLYHPRPSFDSRAAWWTLRLRGPATDSEEWLAWKELVLRASALADRIRVHGEDVALVFESSFHRIEIAGGRAIVEGRA